MVADFIFYSCADIAIRETFVGRRNINEGTQELRPTRSLSQAPIKEKCRCATIADIEREISQHKNIMSKVR